MKNIIITFASLLVLVIPSVSSAMPPSGFGYNDPIQVQLIPPFGGYPIQGLENGLSNISDAIKAQTKALLDAQRQQQIAALNAKCVSDVTAQVRAKDGSIETQKMIDDFISKNSTGGDPGKMQAAASHLNYLYSFINSQNTQLHNVLIKSCAPCPSGYIKSAGQCMTQNELCVAKQGPNTEMQTYNSTTGVFQCKCVSGYTWDATKPACVVQQVQQSIPISGTQCNGKLWNSCPIGQEFYCPSTGDAQCLIDQPVVIGNSDSSVKSGKITDSKISKKDTPDITSQKGDSKSPILLVKKETKKPNIVKTEPKEEAKKTNPEPPKKIKWYQKIFSWFW